MSRQKTKVREWLERQDENGDATEYESESLARSPAERVRGKLVRVTRVRLAPLVELPAWERGDCSDEFVIRHGENALATGGVGILARYFQSVSGKWLATIGSQFVGGDHATADAARAACETRLRELGYRVAKPAKPTASTEQRLGRSLSGRERGRLTGPERDVVAKAKKAGAK